MGRHERIGGVFGGATALAALVLVLLAVVAVPGVAAEPMVVQPDGKIVITGPTWPPAGALARLDPDGSLDPSFGEGGFVIDRRLPSFRALALQPDGRILGAAVGGFQLARYLPNGAPDPEFAAGGIGGSDEPDQVHFLYSDYGPVAVLPWPGGGSVVAGVREAEVGGGATEALVRRYDAAGGLVETTGYLPLPGGPASDARLADLVAEPDGSLVGAGSEYGYPGGGYESRSLLARFVPGSGTNFDPAFGAGAGLVHPPLPAGGSNPSRLLALAVSGEKLLVAGQAAGTFLLGRFNLDGTLDTAFGENGFVAPPIQGASPDVPPWASWGETGSWANDVAVTASGGIVLGGGTLEWSGTAPGGHDVPPHCVECPQPLLARFDASGHLDPGFGSGGIERLLQPDGSVFEGQVEQVTPLADGKLLLAGRVPSRRTTYTPFVARLNADGSYDAGFGQGGLALPRFPCTDQSQTELRRSGCEPTAQLSLRMRRGRRGPALSLRVRPNLPWAGLREAVLTLPRRLAPRPGVKRKLTVRAVGSGGQPKVGVEAAVRGGHSARISVHGFGNARELRVALPAGALAVVGKPLGRRRLAFTLSIRFVDARWGIEAGSQTITRRAG